MSGEVPRVGVGVFVLNDESKFVMGTRKESFGFRTIALPGGHLDFGESFEKCARREVKEETDLEITNVRFLTAVNSVRKREKKHYVTIFMVGEVREQSKALKLMEPEKCEGWFWVHWEEMRSWALSELSEKGYPIEDDAANGAHPSGNELFQPLLNLVRDRPEAVPLRISRTENART